MKYTHKTLLHSVIIAFDDKEVSIRRKILFAEETIRTYRLDEIRHSYSVSRLFDSKGCFQSLVILLFFTALFSILSPFGGDFGIIPFFMLAALIPLLIGRALFYEIETKTEAMRIPCKKSRSEELEAFLEELFAASKLFFKKKYGYADVDIPKEVQFQNYRWLLQNQIITEEEYEELKKTLKDLLK